MRALLLAAGIGSRLRPITDTVPKCLVPIGGRPLLDYWLELLFRRGEVERALINTHHLADKVRAHVAHSTWRDRIDLVHESELLGTGGTVKANRKYFGDQSFVVAHADNLTNFDLARFVAAHAARPPQCTITMLTFRSDDPSSCGIVELDEGRIVRAFHEKTPHPHGDLANAAVYLLSPEAAEFITRLPGRVVDLSTEVIPAFVGRILAVENHGYHRDIGTQASLLKAEKEFSQFSYSVHTARSCSSATGGCGVGQTGQRGME